MGVPWLFHVQPFWPRLSHCTVNVNDSHSSIYAADHDEVALVKKACQVQEVWKSLLFHHWIYKTTEFFVQFSGKSKLVLVRYFEFLPIQINLMS